MEENVTSVKSAWPDHPGYRIDLVPTPAQARVRVGDVVLAESTSALRLIETDHVERLYIPIADVRLDLLNQSESETICPFKGVASYWSYEGPDASIRDLFWTYDDPFPEVAGIKGFLGVYHEKADVELESRWPDGSVEVNRFPAWGDEQDLIRLIDALPSATGRYVAPGYHQRDRDVVEGGQLLGQVIVAASRFKPDQRVTSVSINFMKSASFAEPVEIEIEPLREGRTFSTLSARSTQGGKLIAASMVLLDCGSPDLIRSTEPMPLTSGPEDSEHFDFGVVGRDVRTVEGAYTQDPERVGPPLIDAWVRFLHDPEDSAIRLGLIAQPTTHWTIAAAMLPHPGYGEARAHRDVSTGPVAMSIAFHDDAPVDEWLLYSNPAIWAGRGLAQGFGRVFTRAGKLVASYHLQAMVREPIPQAEGKTWQNAM